MIAGIAILGGAVLVVGGVYLGVNWKNLKLKFSDKTVVSKDTAVVCVGMGNSRVAGSCPGADLDANNMYALLRPYANGGITLLHSNQATYSAVTKAFQNALQHDLCIFFYSGHGSRDEKDKNAAGETDKRNEYLCLYDKMMVDDAVWNLVLGAKGRVVLIFDCCHSGTMYRVLDKDDPSFNASYPHPFTLRRFFEDIEAKRTCLDARHPEGWSIGMSHDEVDALVATEREKLEKGTPKLLCWSAAREFEYSYGDNNGGIFTNALLLAYNKKRTYAEVWSKLVKRMKGQPNEPVRTQFEEGFGGKVFT